MKKLFFAFIIITIFFSCSSYEKKETTLNNCNMKDLIEIINQNDINMLKKKINDGCDPNTAWKTNGYTILMAAVNSNNYEMVEFLIKKGADVNKKDNTGKDAFLNAPYTRNIKLLKLLIKSGADVNTQDNILKDRPIYMAAASRDLKVIDFLIENGAQVNYEVKNCAETPLILAVREKNLDVVKRLLYHGADINAQMCYGLTALMNGVISGSQEMVVLLLEAGANPFIANEKGFTAKDYAKKFNMQKLVEILHDAEDSFNK